MIPPIGHGRLHKMINQIINPNSKRVQEKCGFKYQWKSEDVDVPLMHEKRTGHVSLMTKEDWEILKKDEHRT